MIIISSNIECLYFKIFPIEKVFNAIALQLTIGHLFFCCLRGGWGGRGNSHPKETPLCQTAFCL